MAEEPEEILDLMQPTKWEYQRGYPENMIGWLNKMGANGWELVGFREGWAYLKRPLIEIVENDGDCTCGAGRNAPPNKHADDCPCYQLPF